MSNKVNFPYPMGYISENLPNDLIGKENAKSKCGHPALILSKNDIDNTSYLLGMCSHAYSTPSSTDLTSVNTRSGKVTFLSLDNILKIEGQNNSIKPSSSLTRGKLTNTSVLDLINKLIIRNGIMDSDENFEELYFELLSYSNHDGELKDLPSLKEMHPSINNESIDEEFKIIKEEFLENLFSLMIYLGEEDLADINYLSIKESLDNFSSSMMKDIDSYNLEDQNKSELHNRLVSLIDEYKRACIQMAVEFMISSEIKDTLDLDYDKEKYSKYEDIQELTDYKRVSERTIIMRYLAVKKKEKSISEEDYTKIMKRFKVSSIMIDKYSTQLFSTSDEKKI